ncbi:MAG: RluA family pseudouridine synthase [Staphylococcus sp.]|jgi:pseudouridylate synthase|nr:RluA family pseudouridine synthase [Staphylococcus sp.]
MSLEILYEDNHLIVAIKPAGILSQEDQTKDADMLTLLKYYIKDKYNKPGNVYLGLVHRLDRMTGGVMVFAKTSKAAKRLNEQIVKKDFSKRYYAIVDGIIETGNTLKNYLIKDEKEVRSYIGNSNNGKLAILDYNVIKILNNKTLLDINLITGRHHQIRVQFSHLKHPLVGDVLYGGSHYSQLMLYAYEISFKHPITNDRLTFSKIPTSRLWDQFLK